MNQRLFENIRISAQNLVWKGVAQYEETEGRFKVDAIKQKFLENGLEVLFTIVSRVYENEEISIFSLKNLLLETLFEINFESEILKKVYSNINSELVKFIQKEPNYDAETVREINIYFDLISENIDNYFFYSGSSVADILQNQKEYQYSEKISSFTPIDVDNNKIYTLFPKERYWEVFTKTPEENSYSPLNYNRVVTAAGFPQYKVDISYDDLIVYEGELYKLKPGVGNPSREVFDSNDWIEYSSRRFNTNFSFKEIYLSKIRSIFGKISEDGFDINNIISDSLIPEYSDSETEINVDDFINSFGGAGKQLLQAISQLGLLSNSLGGYQGSLIGGLEYIASFSEYLLSSAFGKDIPEFFDNIDGDSTFAKFNILFASKTSENKIPGLKFLDGFANLKSFTHNQEVFFAPEKKQRITYNPIYAQFADGVTDSFVGLNSNSETRETPKVDLLLYAIESIYVKCGLIGNLTKASLNFLRKDGKSPGYEGLGSVKAQLRNLQKVFPPSRDFIELYGDKDVAPGLTGTIKYFLNNYRKFSRNFVNPILPGLSLEFLGPWIEKITNKLEEILALLEEVGVGSTEFIPNLSFKVFTPEEGDLVNFLKSIGFRDSEINQLLKVQSFTELVDNFAPLSNSSDIKSFFRAYELAQLIYENGGEKAIESYLSFLYSSNSLDSLLNVLDISTKEKSLSTNVSLSKYPRLIGLLIGLTYAIDPQQLIKFNKILGANNLTLLESISFLFQQGEETIIKSPENIRLLDPLIDQLISSYREEDAFATPSLTYEQVNNVAPIALKEWTKIIGDNLGRVSSTELIRNLYDKSIGITPRELITILNKPNSPNAFSGLIDGYEGGQFTSVLKYANITGLAFKLGSYKNSYQTNNFKPQEGIESSPLFEIVKEFKNLIQTFSIFKTVFNASLDYNFAYNADLVRSIEPLIKAQNKVFDVIPDIIVRQTQAESVDQLQLFASSSTILESPGIGNSRIPNRIPVANSLTPEQANLLIENQSNLIELASINTQNLSLINKFIKFSQENALSNGINITEENSGKIQADFKPRKFTPATKYEIEKNLDLLLFSSDRDSSGSEQYSVPRIYQDNNTVSKIASSGLGANYLEKRSNVIDSDLFFFDPVKSCEKFGGDDCQRIYSGTSDRCVLPTNKSLFPETYITVPGTSPVSVVIDRPLGTFAEYKPNEKIVPTTSFEAPPSYYGLLPQGVIPGERGEPILSVTAPGPILFETGGGDVSEYNNSEFALVEFIKAKLEKNSEFGCAGFESPYYYQLCINIMKCKRFIAPFNGSDSLSFCPQTLSGGIFK